MLEINQAFYDSLPKINNNTRRKLSSACKIHTAIRAKEVSFYRKNENSPHQVLSVLAAELNIAVLQLRSYFYVLNTSIAELREMSFDAARAKFQERYLELNRSIGLTYSSSTNQFYDALIPTIQVDTSKLSHDTLKEYVTEVGQLNELSVLFNFHPDTFNTMLSNKGINAYTLRNDYAKRQRKQITDLFPKTPYPVSITYSPVSIMTNSFLNGGNKGPEIPEIRSCMTASYQEKEEIRITKLTYEPSSNDMKRQKYN